MCGLCHERVPIVVDHNHTTGERRALLCGGCNIALGTAERKDWLRKAAAYLVKWAPRTKEASVRMLVPMLFGKFLAGGLKGPGA